MPTTKWPVAEAFVIENDIAEATGPRWPKMWAPSQFGGDAGEKCCLGRRVHDQLPMLLLIVHTPSVSLPLEASGRGLKPTRVGIILTHSYSVSRRIRIRACRARNRTPVR